jgi:hypothetical protein
MRGSWDDFTSKFGFQDGEALEQRDINAWNCLAKILSAHPSMLKAGLVAFPWWRGGCHNPCLVIVIKGKPAEKQSALKKRWEASGGDEESLPADVQEEIEDLIDRAYREAPAKRRKGARK